MLGWALTFLLIALIAGALGFGGIAGAAGGIAQLIFYATAGVGTVNTLVRARAR